MESRYKDRVEVLQYQAINKGEDYLIIGYDNNLQWVKYELEYFLDLFSKGISIEDICTLINRPILEIAFLVMYLTHRKPNGDRQPLLKWAEKEFNKLLKEDTHVTGFIPTTK